MTRVLVVLAATCAALVWHGEALRGQVVIEPTSPPGLGVVVRDGTKTHILRVDPPEVKSETVTAKAPVNYASWMEPWQPWPSKGKDGSRLTMNLSPAADEDGTQILSGLFRQILPDSIVVTSADGSRTFKKDEDYRLNEDWGQIVNLNNRLGAAGEAEVKVSFQYGLVRLDLVQKAPDGTVSVKKGVSRMVCPALPDPDPGCAALAGIFVDPWKKDGRYALAADCIYPIAPKPPVLPIRKEAVSRTVAKLREGKEVKIAFLGDSVTLGAEAPRWWADLWTEKNLGYPSRVITALRKMYPRSVITPIAGFKGGTGTKYGLEVLEKTVLPEKPDLVLIAFGANDMSGPIGGKPNNPVESFKSDIEALVRKAKEVGAEAMLICPLQTNPRIPKDERAARLPSYRQAILDAGEELSVAVADVTTEWLNQAFKGIPPFLLLHNCNNHPGIAGHQIYAEVILRFLEPAGTGRPRQ
mgnify:CR=1 FL=1